MKSNIKIIHGLEVRGVAGKQHYACKYQGNTIIMMMMR